MSESRNSDQTDSHDNIDGNSKSKERKLKEFFSPFSAMMYNVDELIGKVSVFPKDHFTGRNHFNGEREIQIAHSIYVHARLKFGDKFTASPQFIFNAV